VGEKVKFCDSLVSLEWQKDGELMKKELRNEKVFKN
jgi:hypothetical protein